MHRISFLMLIVATVSGCGQPPSQSAAAPESSTSKEEMMATLINLNGKLCAKVILVSPEVSPGEYQVNCEEYRDPSKAKTKNNMVVYMVNLNRNSVKLVGRG